MCICVCVMKAWKMWGMLFIYFCCYSFMFFFYFSMILRCSWIWWILFLEKKKKKNQIIIFCFLLYCVGFSIYIYCENNVYTFSKNMVRVCICGLIWDEWGVVNVTTHTLFFIYIYLYIVTIHIFFCLLHCFDRITFNSNKILYCCFIWY